MNNGSEIRGFRRRSEDKKSYSSSKKNLERNDKTNCVKYEGSPLDFFPSDKKPFPPQKKASIAAAKFLADPSKRLMMITMPPAGGKTILEIACARS